MHAEPKPDAHAPSGPEPLSPIIEDYAKAIYKLERAGTRGGAVSNMSLAQELEVSPAAITAMVKRLEELGLARYEPYKGASLTERGERVALEVIRHHRLLEAYLSDVLGMSWDRVHDEAEVLEHYISEELEELIASALGDPDRDPHGDPIPTRELTLADETSVALEGCEPGARGVFVRVSDSDAEMLRYLAGMGVAPGDRFEVVDRQPFGGPLSVRFGDGEPRAIGGALSRAMRVEVEEAGR